MKYILFDGSINPFISDRSDLISIASPQKKTVFLKWLSGSLKIIKESKSGDTLVFWFDFQAILAWWICKLTFRRRKLVCINIMLKQKDTLKNKTIAFLYKIALKDLNFKATVTSPKYGEWLCKRLNIQREFYLLHDVFYKNATQYLAPEINPKSIFCGGHNGRDWKFIIDLAKQMPDVIFNIVMPGEVYRKYEESFTSNIHAKHDIARDSFYQILSESALACLPLDTEAPAGLIVMFCAAGYGKMVMTTDTVTTSEYIRDGRGECLPKDIDIWCERIRFYLNHPEQAKSCSQNLLDYFEKECSEDCFVKTLMNIIDDKAVSEK